MSNEENEWLALTSDPLPIPAIYEWAVAPECGAIVLFSGTVRDHAEGRDDVVALEYEAYDEVVVPVFRDIVRDMRDRFPAAVKVHVVLP